MSASISKDYNIYALLFDDSSVSIINNQKVIGEISANSLGYIYCLIITNDNRYLIISSKKYNIVIWNIPENRQEAILSSHREVPYCFAVSSDNLFVIAGHYDDAIIVWNLTTFDKEFQFLGNSLVIGCVAITSDNLYVLSGEFEEVKIWCMSNRVLKAKLNGHTSYVNCIAITSDNKIAVSGADDNCIIVWDLIRREQKAMLSGHSKLINCIGISNDDNYIISGSNDRTVRVWNLWDEIKELSIRSHLMKIINISIKNNKYIITETKDSIVLVWKLNKFQSLNAKKHSRTIKNITNNTPLSEHSKKKNNAWKMYKSGKKNYFQSPNEGDLNSAIISKNRFIMLGSDEKSICEVFEKSYTVRMPGHTGEISKIFITKDKKFAITGSFDMLVRVWNLQESYEQIVFYGHQRVINDIAVTSDNKFIVSGSEDSTLRVWNLPEGRSEMVFYGHKSGIKCVHITKNDKYVITGSSDMTVKLWNLIDNTFEASFMVESININCILSSQDNQCMVVLGSNFKILDLNQKMIIKDSEFYSVCAVSKDGVLCAFYLNDCKALHVWNIQKKQKIAILQNHTDHITYAILPNKDFLILLSNDSTVVVWNLTNQTQEAVLRNCQSNGNNIAITTDCQYLIFCGVLKTKENNKISIWNIISKKRETGLKGHTKSISAIGVSKDNKFIVSGSWDKTIRVWNFADKNQIAVFKGHKGYITNVAITNNNLFVVSGSNDKSIRVWNMKKRQQEVMVNYKTYNIEKNLITNDDEFLVLVCSDNMIRIADFLDQSQKMCIKVSDNNLSKIFLADDSDQIYVNNFFGISTVNIKEKKIIHEIFFDQDCQNICNDSPEECKILLPILLEN